MGGDREPWDPSIFQPLGIYDGIAQTSDKFLDVNDIGGIREAAPEIRGIKIVDVRGLRSRRGHSEKSRCYAESNPAVAEEFWSGVSVHARADVSGNGGREARLRKGTKQLPCQ